MDGQNLFRIVRDNWLSVLAFALLGFSVGLLLASQKAPEYTAEAEVFVTVTNGGSTNELAQGSNYSQQQARNFSAVATREIVLGPVIEELGLDTTLGDLREQVRASVPLNTSLISIEVTNPDPVQAAAIANAIAKSLSDAANSLAPQIEDLNRSPVRLQLVENAEPPTSPSVPNVPMWLILGLAAGIVAGVGWVAVREFVVARVRTKEQVEAAVHLSMLGRVSLDRTARRHPIAITADPFSTRAEEYRQLRSSLRFLSPGVQHKAFVISSSVPGEGKSTTAANLAVAIAASGQSVCLVEADLRRPSLGDVLDLESSVGLSTVLAGEASVAEVTQEWGDHGLHVILAGALPPNPSELLESARAEEIFAEIRNAYSVIVVDSPPINAVADATTLSRLLGGTVLVIGAKQVQVRELRRAVEQLSAVHVPIHGYVLNGDTSPRRNRAYYRHEVRPTEPPDDEAEPQTPTSPSSPEPEADEVPQAPSAHDRADGARHAIAEPEAGEAGAAQPEPASEPGAADAPPVPHHDRLPVDGNGSAPEDADEPLVLVFDEAEEEVAAAPSRRPRGRSLSSSRRP